MTHPGSRPGDADLIRAAQAGDTGSLGMLIERHFGTVYAVALARLRDPELAEDLAQEVFLRVQLHIGRFAADGNFPAWVTRIARNLAIDWLLRGSRASRLLSMVPLDEAALGIHDTKAKGVRETMASQEETLTLRRAIMDLAAEQREVVLLHFSEELTQQEIAGRLGVSQATVSRLIGRALSSLRGTLEPALREVGPALRAPRGAVAKSLLVASVVGGMSAASKTALAAQATQEISALSQAAPAAAGFLASLKAACAALIIGGKGMATGKGIAATAVAVAAITVGTYQYTRDTGPRGDRPIETVHGAYPYTCTLVWSQSGSETSTVQRQVLRPGRIREERENGIFIWDQENHPDEYLFIESRWATLTTVADLTYPGDLLARLPELRAEALEVIDGEEIDGIPARHLRGASWDLWLSEANGLPLRCEMRSASGPEVIHTDFNYGVAMNESPFAMVSPPDRELREQICNPVLPGERDLIAGLRAAITLTGGDFPPEISSEWLDSQLEALRPRMSDLSEAELARLRSAEESVRRAIQFVEDIRAQRGQWVWRGNGFSMEFPYPGAYLGYHWLPDMPVLRFFRTDLSIRDGGERATPGATPEATIRSHFAEMTGNGYEEWVSSLYLPFEEALEIRREMGEIASPDTLSEEALNGLRFANTDRFREGHSAIRETINSQERLDPPVEFVRMISGGNFRRPDGTVDETILLGVQMEIRINGESRVIDVGDMVRRGGRWYIL